VRGSGVVVGGHGDWDGHGDGGTLRISSLRTGAVHTDGGVPTGTPDLSGGVFVIPGVVVDEVVNEGPVTTLGSHTATARPASGSRNRCPRSRSAATSVLRAARV